MPLLSVFGENKRNGPSGRFCHAFVLEKITKEAVKLP